MSTEAENGFVHLHLHTEYSLLDGEHHVTPDHIRQVAHPVLRHRILLNFNAEADGIGTDDVIDELLKEVSIDDLDERTRRHMDEVTR